ncbi:MAG: heavy-metal-associated domain-containing protein [Dysgonomonas sp.]|jgi:copper chaperone CopZ|nr:heavy metal-associated domain-containing protein [Dysgonomonas gadei]MBF0648929.1 heavy-metal-associated domain-containing protein [Dysgonomonas sp. GY75]
MKLKLFLMTVILMMGISTTVDAQNKKPLKNDKETVLFDVSMTCENCQKRIEKNIAFEKGVTDMKVDLENKTVLIEFKKTQTTVENLKAAIEKLGYEVKIHNSEQKK